MDPVTHTLVGAALGRTRLGQTTRLGAAALVLGANLPDIDVLSHAWGSDAAFGFRRGWTHGLPAMLILPALLVLALTAWARLRPPRAGSPPFRIGALIALAYVGCWTHPALDWLNTYGVRLLMPFDGRWFYGDSVFIVDPWLWLLWGGAALVGSSGRVFVSGWLLIGSLSLAAMIGAGAREMLPGFARIAWPVGLVVVALLHLRARTRGRSLRRVAVVGLVSGLGYIVLLIGLSAAGESWVRAELSRRGVTEVRRLMVGPYPADPLSWEVVVETSEAYRRGRLRWSPRPSLTLEPDAIPIVSSPTVDAALAAPGFQGTLSWMRFPFAEVESGPGGHTVHVIDARYLRYRRSRFGHVAIHLDP